MITIRGHSYDNDIAVIGYIMGSIRATLDSSASDSEKLVAIDALQKDVEFAVFSE